MGGSAFADPKDPSGSLHTPRMPLHIYNYARDRALRILDNLYAHARCPIEAPAKADYGDVDILVACPHDQAKTTTASLAAALGATQYKNNGPMTNFALPWPTVEELNASLSPDIITTTAQPNVAATSPSTNSKTSLGASHHDTTNLHTTDIPRYIQLDVHACPTAEHFHWELFHQAHGDLWNILGGMIWPYGIVVNNVGLYLRLAGVHNISKDQRMIQLTTSPDAVLDFLDLDRRRYWTPFESLDAMFAYAAECRFHNPKAYGCKEDLKANDRLRMKKRPMFRKWYEEYLREHREDEPGRSAGVGREEVIEEAKTTFGVEKEYEEKRDKGLWKMGEEKVWSDIRNGLPVEGLRIGVVMRGVKREVLGKTGAAAGPRVLSDDKDEVVDRMLRANADEDKRSDMQRAYAEGRFVEIKKWAQAEFEAIEQRQNAYERAQSTKHLLDKLEREKAKMAVAPSEPETGTEKGAAKSVWETAKMQQVLGQG